MLKSQDLVVAAAIGAHGPRADEALAQGIGLSVGEARAATERLQRAGLVSADGRLNVPQLLELVTHGLRFVWPLEPGAVVLGMPTAGAAPMFRDDGDFPDPPALPFVWEYAGPGAVSGIAVSPLDASVPAAAARDPALYALLALFDAARAPSARERNAARKKLGVLLGNGEHMTHFNEANHAGIASGDIASFPIGALTLEAYGPFAQGADVEQMMPDWYAASIIFDSAGLIASDGSIMETLLTLEEIVGNRSTNRRSKAVLESLLQFDQSVAALLARATTAPGDDLSSRVRRAALPVLSFHAEAAGDLPLHPAIVKAALARL
jgi:hypothetical protein